MVLCLVFPPKQLTVHQLVQHSLEILHMPLMDLTNFGSTEMRASNDVYRGAIARNGDVKGDDDIPVFDERRDPIDKASEERQEGELDSHHCHPGEYEARCDQLTKFENPVEIWRMSC